LLQERLDPGAARLARALIRVDAAASALASGNSRTTTLASSARKSARIAVASGRSGSNRSFMRMWVRRQRRG